LELLDDGTSFSASAAGVPLVAGNRGRPGGTHPLLDKAAQCDLLTAKAGLKLYCRAGAVFFSILGYLPAIERAGRFVGMCGTR
jgi:hypothetical protein